MHTGRSRRCRGWELPWGRRPGLRPAAHFLLGIDVQRTIIPPLAVLKDNPVAHAFRATVLRRGPAGYPTVVFVNANPYLPVHSRRPVVQVQARFPLVPVDWPGGTKTNPVSPIAIAQVDLRIMGGSGSRARRHTRNRMRPMPRLCYEDSHQPVMHTARQKAGEQNPEQTAQHAASELARPSPIALLTT